MNGFLTVGKPCFSYTIDQEGWSEGESHNTICSGYFVNVRAGKRVKEGYQKYLTDGKSVEQFQKKNGINYLGQRNHQY